MATTTILSANEILNRVAAEVGVQPVTDPYSSTDPSFIKMRYLINIAGEELTQAHNWEFMNKTHTFTTDAATYPTGEYPLPADFGSMINQTGWEQSQRVPLGGPLTSQDWAYLEGRNFSDSTIYASFRLNDGLFNIYPSPPADGLIISYQYVSIAWARSATAPFVYTNDITVGTQLPLFDRTLMTRYLKLKFLEATGFDSTKAQEDFSRVFLFLTSKDKGAGVLSQGSNAAYPYISNLNLPITGYGL